MKYKSISFIQNYLTQIITEEYNSIIDNISKDYNINSSYLKNKYINKKNISYNISNNINLSIRCSGIIKSGCQCARTRKSNSLFCKIHQKTLKFGKIIL
tara:strand:+ start:348 stop:644 length:297 start_codon:yes stop_codon:yes gene_type:complete